MTTNERRRNITSKRSSTAQTIALSVLMLFSLVTLAGAGLFELGGTNNAFAGTFPGDNGKIAFRAIVNGNSEVFVMNSDGTSRTNISNTPTEPEDSRPSWSHDGLKIAFDSVKSGNRDIYTMNATGGVVTKITSDPALDYEPSWSPDGSQIVFRSTRGGLGDEIYRMNADGSGVVRLTFEASSDFTPVWSPDGTKIAFVATRDGGNHDIYVMNAADGSSPTRLTTDPAQDTWPNWSPDGTKIAFTSGRPDDEAIGDTDIYVMNAADGTGVTRLTTDPSTTQPMNDVGPSWSPDGTKIAFGSNRDFAVEIYTMNAADGSGLTRLTNNFVFENVPDWGPVPNQPPAANAGLDQTVNEGAPVSLNGAASSDPDGTISSYSWTQTAGTPVVLTSANSATPSFTAPSVGSAGETLTFELTVTDNKGATDTDTVDVTVQNVNVLPTANAGADFAVDEETLGVQLQGSGADSDGTISSYLWEQTSGPSVALTNADTATATFDAPSVSADTALEFKLTVTDNDSGSGLDIVQVTVRNVNQNPTANAGTDQTVNEGDNVALDGTGSSDSDGTIQSYSWGQTAGTSVTLDDPSSATPSFTAPSVGSAGETLTFELTVTDSDGGTDTDTVDINVQNVNQLPTANAGADFSVNEGTSGVQLDGSSSTDPDGTIASYQWEQTDGPTVTITNADSAIATFDAPEVSANTPLTFKLSVTDNDGGTDDDTIVVTVNDVESTLLEIEGFYAPVDMNNVINTIKGGKSVPLKFEIFEVVRDGSGNEISRTEITDTSAIQSFTHEQILCSEIESTGTDSVETTNSFGTIEPRYDTSSGQFIGNWKSASAAGKCFAVEVTTEDDSATAYFKTK